MASVNVPLPFEAYRGSEPYIFVSYSHKDGERVYPLLRELRDLGYRVWYDEGIDPGNEWPEEIAKALVKAAHFLVFLTPNAAGSRNVRNEINFALTEMKPFLAVHLDDFKLPDGLRLRISDIQAILKWRLSDGHYRRALEKTLPAVLQEADVPTAGVPASGPPSRSGGSVTPRNAGDIQTVNLGNGLGMDMVYCPAGMFIMGSPASEQDRSEDEAQHRVTLTKGFWMGKYPVTQEQWIAVMGSNPSHFQGFDHPVEQVSWDDCQAFCQKLNGMLGTGNSKSGEFRLPTESEWEYACRAGTGTAFSYGDSLDATMANFDGNYPYGGAVTGVYLQKTTPIGSFCSNAWGLYDMHGNVWEWCADWYGSSRIDAVTDPKGAASGSNRVARGGSWFSDAQYCRSAYRIGVTLDYLGYDLGFRVARSLL